MIILRNKQFTQWDETDRLKAMKDSDILAEKSRSTTSAGSMIRSGVAGAALGGLTAGGVGAAMALRGGTAAAGGRLAAATAGARPAALAGAAVGAGIGATVSWLKNRKKNNENRFYNQRLAYAQRQALRRERKDWKTNMTQRDGYTY